MDMNTETVEFIATMEDDPTDQIAVHLVLCFDNDVQDVFVADGVCQTYEDAFEVAQSLAADDPTNPYWVQTVNLTGLSNVLRQAAQSKK